VCWVRCEHSYGAGRQHGLWVLGVCALVDHTHACVAGCRPAGRVWWMLSGSLGEGLLLLLRKYQ
jgi:hypothetical protein